MSKELAKGIVIGDDNVAAEATETTEYEMNEEDTRALIRANEEDFIQGLIDAADFASTSVFCI